MDFVTGLPEVDDFDAILVTVDHLTKMRHFSPCRTDCTAEDLAELFLRDVFRLHGLPEITISDRGTQFASRFWTRICQRLQINRKMSTAYHPETDGQTERANAVMEQYLRAYVSYQQDNWIRFLPLAEFAANNAVSESTSVSPFFANGGFHPRVTDTLDQEAHSPEARTANEKADQLHQIREHVRLELVYAQDRHESTANAHRLPAPSYEVGDEVWLRSRHIRTDRPSRKLDWKRLGRFKVSARISPYAYRLDLPASMRIHPVFHVSLLEPARDDPLPGQIQPPPPPVVVEGEDEYEVEEVLDARIRRGVLQYLIKWTGYDRPDWEPAKQVNGLAAIDEFHRRYPDKPEPLPEDDG